MSFSHLRFVNDIFEFFKTAILCQKLHVKRQTSMTCKVFVFFRLFLFIRSLKLYYYNNSANKESVEVWSQQTLSQGYCKTCSFKRARGSLFSILRLRGLIAFVRSQLRFYTIKFFQSISFILLSLKTFQCICILYKLTSIFLRFGVKTDNRASYQVFKYKVQS